VLQENFPAIPNAAALVASPLIRRSATLGGNLLLDTRCWHFNQTVEWRRAHGSCLKAEADICRVLPLPGDVCVATFSGDLAPVLLVYGAQFHLFGNSGPRVVDAADFYAEDGIRRFRDKKADEILVQASLPDDAIQWQVNYQKLRLRDTFDFPEGGVAVGLQLKKGLVTAARIATTAYGSIPMLHFEPAKILLGQPLQSEVIEEVAYALLKEVRPMKNTSMSPAYRKKMARVLCRRALVACGN
jgi:4-hydroxybenzoyl-CoA reductase subunit beta